MDKNILRHKALMLMALRCEFIEGLKLTKKGWGFLTAKQWRIVNNIKSWMFPQWEKDMIHLLRWIQKHQ